MDALTTLPADLHLLAAWEQAHPRQAGFLAGLDERTRTVRVMGAGVWHEEDALRYFDQQIRIVAEARRRFGTLKVFFDVRDWIVEGPHSALQFQDMNNEIYTPDDRLVAVVRSSSGKQHPRTALGAGNRGAFISISAAETWLQAYSHGETAAG